MKRPKLFRCIEATSALAHTNLWVLLEDFFFLNLHLIEIRLKWQNLSVRVVTLRYFIQIDAINFDVWIANGNISMLITMPISQRKFTIADALLAFWFDFRNWMYLLFCSNFFRVQLAFQLLGNFLKKFTKLFTQ